jgi:hypothetical protein
LDDDGLFWVRSIEMDSIGCGLFGAIDIRAEMEFRAHSKAYVENQKQHHLTGDIVKVLEQTKQI